MLVLWGTYPSPLLCLALDEAVLRSHTWWQCCHHFLMILSSSLSSLLPSTTPSPPHPHPHHHHHPHPHHLYVLLSHTGLVGEAPRSESFQLLLPWQCFKLSKIVVVALARFQTFKDNSKLLLPWQGFKLSKLTQSFKVSSTLEIFFKTWKLT